MKKLILISVFFCFIFSCSKKEDLLPVDCSHYLDLPPIMDCRGTICQSDTCTTYLGIWKELFMSKNQMTEDYFNNHITICNTAVYKYAEQGIQFELAYRWKIDWFEVRFSRGFMIWLHPSYLTKNPSVNLPANILLSKDQISANIDNPFFSDPVVKISSVDHLNYSTMEAAVSALSHSAGVTDMCRSNMYVQYQDVANPPLGHPVLSVSAVLNWDENKCVSGIMDLSSDYIKTENDACYISFCFTMGTGIIQSNTEKKPIEKVIPGDTVLSVNLKLMTIEKDCVEKVDSVTHNDLIEIKFRDKTTLISTSDHPYFVKGKGWCSFNPEETQLKLNIIAGKLETGDICFKYLNNKLTECKIESAANKTESFRTYNISKLKKNKNYFANGILVSTEYN